MSVPLIIATLSRGRRSADRYVEVVAITVELPTDLRALLEPLIADLVRTADVDLQLVDVALDHEGYAFTLTSDVGRIGVRCDNETSAVERLASVADQVQAVVIAERFGQVSTRAAWPE